MAPTPAAYFRHPETPYTWPNCCNRGESPDVRTDGFWLVTRAQGNALGQVLFHFGRHFGLRRFCSGGLRSFCSSGATFGREGDWAIPLCGLEAVIQVEAAASCASEHTQRIRDGPGGSGGRGAGEMSRKNTITMRLCATPVRRWGGLTACRPQTWPPAIPLQAGGWPGQRCVGTSANHVPQGGKWGKGMGGRRVWGRGGAGQQQSDVGGTYGHVL